ncbi:hypothetical protein EBS02_03125 [bacterium]|nr:hypothetical protein [bacterium]
MPVLTHAQEDQYRQSLADAFIIKTADGILPSPLYYSMVLQATLPDGWSCGVEVEPAYHVTIDHQKAYIERYQKEQKDKLLTIARGLLGAKEDAEVSFAQLHQSLFPDRSQQAPSAVPVLNYAAVQEFFPKEMLPHHVRNFFSKAGLDTELTAVSPEKMDGLLQRTISENAQQTAQDRLLRVLQMTYATKQEAHDELVRLGVNGQIVGPEQKQILVIKDEKGTQQDINEFLDQLAMNKEDIQKRMSEQTGMNQEWLHLIRLLFSRSNTDGLDLCHSLAAEGFNGLSKEANNILDSAEIKRQCHGLQAHVLALGSAYQQEHPEHYFHYYTHDEAIKDHIKDFILEKINSRFLGFDYYGAHDFPCQHELVAKIIRELIATNRLENIEAQKTLVYWLFLQGCVEPLESLFKLDRHLTNLSVPVGLFRPSLLMLAIECNQQAIVKLLVENGADINAKDTR